MKKILRAFFLGFIALILLVLAVPFVIDINDYRDDIVMSVRQATGKDIEVNGPIAFELLPKVAIVINDAAYSQTMDTSRLEVAVEQVDIRLKLWPLFKAQFEVDSIAIKSPHITLSSSELLAQETVLSTVDSSDNAEVDTLPELKNSEGDAHVKKEAQNILSALQLEKLMIKDGRFEHVDQAIIIENIAVTTSYFYQQSNPFEITGNVVSLADDGQFTAKGDYQLSEAYYAFEKVHFKMGKGVDLFGTFGVDLNARIPEINFALNSEFLDITPYVTSKPPVKPADQKPVQVIHVEEMTHQSNHIGTQQESFQWSDEPFDLDFLKTFDGHVNLKTKGLKVWDYQLGVVALNAHLKSGRLSLNVKELEAYDGHTMLKSDINVNGPAPRVTIELAIRELDAGLLAKDVAAFDKFAGKLTLDSTVISRGNSIKSLVESTNGALEFAITEGKIQGLNLLDMANNVASAFNIYEGIDDSTAFRRISGNFDIKDGVISGNDFLIENTVLHFHGAGKIDLPEVRIDYKLTPKLAPGREVVGVRLPVIIRGDLFKPVFRLEVESIVRDVLANPKDVGGKIINQIQRELKTIEDGAKKRQEQEKPLESIKDVLNEKILDFF